MRNSRLIFCNIILALILMTIGCCNRNFCFVKDEDITNMYSSYVEEWKNNCKIAFDKAEKEIFKEDDPTPPKPNDGTDKDPAKCICRGTGIIVQGDGHKTTCPFHGKTSQR